MLVMVTVTSPSRSLVLVIVTDEVTSWHSLGCKTSPDTYTNAESKISVKKIAMSNVRWQMVTVLGEGCDRC